MEILRRDNVVEHFWKFGASLMKQMNDLATELGIGKYFSCEGYPCSPNYITKGPDGKPSLAFRTLFSQEMVSQGILMPYVALSFAHKEADLERTIDACKLAFRIYGRALEEGIEKYLKSPVIKPVFRQYN